MGAVRFHGRHCGQVFEGPEGAAAWVEHFRVEHKRRQDEPGSDVNGRGLGRKGGKPAPGWAGGEMLPPHAWVAPRPVRGRLTKLELELAA